MPAPGSPAAGSPRRSPGPAPAAPLPGRTAPGQTLLSFLLVFPPAAVPARRLPLPGQVPPPGQPPELPAPGLPSLRQKGSVPGSRSGSLPFLLRQLPYRDGLWVSFPASAAAPPPAPPSALQAGLPAGSGSLRRLLPPPAPWRLPPPPCPGHAGFLPLPGSLFSRTFSCRSSPPPAPSFYSMHSLPPLPAPCRTGRKRQRSFLSDMFSVYTRKQGSVNRRPRSGGQLKAPAVPDAKTLQKRYDPAPANIAQSQKL